MPHTADNTDSDFDWLSRIDPAYDNARRSLANAVCRRDAPALLAKHRNIIIAVILGCRAYPTAESALQNAVAAGATLREIVEGFEVAAILGGFPAIHYVLPFLSKLHAQSGDAILGSTPSASAETKAAARGPAVSKGMSEWAWLDAIDPAYEKAHQDLTRLVWTPTAPALPVKIRELVASAVLAYRAFPTLEGHLRRAVREGASVREAVEAMEAAALPGGFPVIHFALPSLQKINDEIDAGTFR